MKLTSTNFVLLYKIMPMKQLKITTKITSRDSYSIDRYLSEIARMPVLSEDEEVRLAKRIRDGDNKALEILIKSNLRFVVSVAKQYQNHGLSLNDLVNEGNIGLIKAALRFDETKGFKFISYAVWWIRQSILNAVIEYPRIVRVPMNKATLYAKITKESNDFEQKNERQPSVEELSESLDMNTEELRQLLLSLNYHSSLDTPIGDDEDTHLIDMISDTTLPTPDNKLMQESLHKDIHDAMGALTHREVLIINLFYGLGGESRMYSLEEISNIMGLTRERVRQIKDKALRKLRKSSVKKFLLTYLS